MAFVYDEDFVQQPSTRSPVRHATRNATIIRMRRAGREPTDIASALGVSRNTVIGVLYRAGMTDKASPQANGRRIEPAYRDLVLAASERFGPEAAAAQWGVAANTVRRWIQGL